MKIASLLAGAVLAFSVVGIASAQNGPSGRDASDLGTDSTSLQQLRGHLLVCSATQVAPQSSGGGGAGAHRGRAQWN